MEEAGGETQPGLHELAQAVDVEGCDGEDDWAVVKEGLWTAAGVVGLAVAAGAAFVAIGAGVQAIQESNRRRAAAKGGEGPGAQ